MEKITPGVYKDILSYTIVLWSNQERVLFANFSKGGKVGKFYMYNHHSLLSFNPVKVEE